MWRKEKGSKSSEPDITYDIRSVGEEEKAVAVWKDGHRNEIAHITGRGVRIHEEGRKIEGCKRMKREKEKPLTKEEKKKGKAKTKGKRREKYGRRRRHCGGERN